MRTSRQLTPLALLAMASLAACDRSPTEVPQLQRVSASSSMVAPWTLQTPLCDTAGFPAATGHPNGRVYVFGGYKGDPLRSGFLVISRKTQIYDPATKQWYLGTQMPMGVFGAAAAVGSDGKIYVVAGTRTGGQGPGASDRHQIYDPTTNTWTLGTPVPLNTILHGAAAAGGKIYVFGGNGPGTMTKTHIYDPLSNSWSVGSPMPTPRIGLAAVTGPDGRIYVVGGVPDFQGAAHASMDIYDPATNTWSAGAPMSRGRSGLAAALGADGRIYATGGNAQYLTINPTASVESYDPGTNTWRAEPDMNVARAAHGAALAGDGFIYAIGYRDPATGRGRPSVEALGAAANDTPGECGAPPPPGPIDNTPPLIAPDVIGTLGSTEWFISDVTVSWTVTDDESSITSTVGCGATSLTADTFGTIVTCSATSAGGSASESVTIKIDQTDPTVTYSGNAGAYALLDAVNISCAASDATSGIESSTCSDVAGAAWSFGAGTHTVSASATDVAGNTGSSTATFVVVVTYAGLFDLVSAFVSNAGIANSLVGKLRNAAAAEARGQMAAHANLLNAFRNEVRAQTGKALTAEQAAVLLSFVDEL